MGNIKYKSTYEKYTGMLGDEFGTVYYHALSEWCDLWITWRQFENLFGCGPERVELMNRSGAGFFYRVDRHFFEAVVLAVCRLSDPEETAGRRNMTVMLFKKFMDTDDRRAKVGQLLDEVSQSTAFARDWRNRRISHNDYELKSGMAEPLKDATRDLMNKAIGDLHKVIAFVSTEFMDTALYDEVIDDNSNEMAMLRRLYRGDEAFQRELDGLRNGRGCVRELPMWLNNQN